MGKSVQSKSTEKQIENAILEYLNYQIGVFAFKVNTMGVFDQRGFYRRLSKYILPGTPDIIACMNYNGFPLFIGMEVKSHSGKQSKEQKSFENRLKERSNGFYFVVRSIQDAEAALNSIKEIMSQKAQCIMA